MSPELDAALCSKYPKIFRLRSTDKNSSFTNFGFECHDGWYSLIDVLCTQIQSHVDDKGIAQIEARQVKEKFGGLRFYHTSGDDVVFSLVSFAESMSEVTCEICGRQAIPCVANGWVATRCDLHKTGGL
jgi:ribosomal protein S27E